MDSLWAIPICFLGFGIICLSIGSYKYGKRIATLELDIKKLKEKVKLSD